MALSATECKTAVEKTDPAPLPAYDALAHPHPGPFASKAPGDAGALAHPQPRDTDFVDLQTLMPEVVMDMRYASANNFLGKAIYPEPRCLLRKPVALALQRVQARLKAEGLQILLWDCYRPFSIQEMFWKHHPVPAYVAKPLRSRGKPTKGSKHNRGAAVDLTLQLLNGSDVEMPTDHDDFSPAAHLHSKGRSAAVQANVDRLHTAMQAESFHGIDTEWWHFDFSTWREFDLSDQPLR